MGKNLTASYVQSLTGDLNTILDWRVIHDTNKGEQGRNIRGTLEQVYDVLQGYNAAGWGVFVNINALDGKGAELINVAHIRTHVVDLDDPTTAAMNYSRAVSSNPPPHFAVQTSPDKYHLYWLVQPYTGNDFYTLHQRKIAQLYDGDRKIVDATRVLRVPGFYHMKNPAQPFMVSCWGVSNQPHYSAADIQHSFAHVNVMEMLATRHPLGDPDLQAPSLQWLQFALSLVNPNDMDRTEWLSFSAAVKQAGWSLADEQTLLRVWQTWCSQYSGNDQAENMKLWNSVRNSQVGWPTIEKRTTVKAYLLHGFKEPPTQSPAPVPATPAPSPSQMLAATTVHDYGEILSEHDCAKWFENCFFVEREGKMLVPSGRLLNSNQFNGRYGGKHFIITTTGKTTDEPWKAALRSTCYSVPKVDHIRFLPGVKSFDVVRDNLGRCGVNTYIPAVVDSRPGDVNLWLQHVAKILPNPLDQQIWFDYLAHCVKYPGYKIQYAVMLQGAEGIGKTVFTEVLKHALGSMYVYQPKAPELVASGSKFNAWMRGKLAIVVDEIKVDERRELIEILKPMITDASIEVQSKGVDQEMEDNCANWIFFSNHRDAIPINKNGRRYAVLFSALQYESDMIAAGMDKAYFERLWQWLRNEGGLAAITHWLQSYPIEQGGLPVRAPRTTSYNEALRLSRSPMEVVVEDCVTDGVTGFRGGFVSVQAVMHRVKLAGIKTPAARSVQNVLESMGYHYIGKTLHPVPQEDINNRSVLYHIDPRADVSRYEQTQGYIR